MKAKEIMKKWDITAGMKFYEGDVCTDIEVISVSQATQTAKVLRYEKDEDGSRYNELECLMTFDELMKCEVVR